MATSICGVHSTSPACPVDRHARGTPCALVLSAPFTDDVSRRNAPATTYPVHLAVSRETHSEPSRWYSDSTDRIALPCPRGQPDTPMQGRVFPIRLKESGNLLHGSVPSDDTQRMRSGALRTSVLRVRACMRSHVVFIARQRAGSSPGEGSEHPVPHANMNPCEHWRYFHRPNQNENGPSATRCSFHVKPSPAQAHRS